MGVFLCAWPGVKADLFFPNSRRFQHLLEGRKDGTKFRVIALFSQVNKSAQAGVGDLHGARAAQNTGEHRHTLFGERVGKQGEGGRTQMRMGMMT